MLLEPAAETSKSLLDEVSRGSSYKYLRAAALLLLRFPGYSFPLPILPTLRPAPFPTHSQAVGMSPPGLQPPTFGSGCGFGPTSALAPHTYLPPAAAASPACQQCIPSGKVFSFSSNGKCRSCYCLHPLTTGTCQQCPSPAVITLVFICTSQSPLFFFFFNPQALAVKTKQIAKELGECRKPRDVHRLCWASAEARWDGKLAWTGAIPLASGYPSDRCLPT